MRFKTMIQQKANLYLVQHPANRIDSLNNLVIFDRLLIAYGSAHDPLFEKLK